MSRKRKGIRDGAYSANFMTTYPTDAQAVADEIVAKKGAYASGGGHRICPGCDDRYTTSYTGSALTRPTCLTCWPRLPLALRNAWRNRADGQRHDQPVDNRMTAQEVRQQICQWFLDNASSTEGE